jgi:hypothetical protein
VFKVESAEMFFDDAELLKTRQVGLGRFEQLAAEAMQTLNEEVPNSYWYTRGCRNSSDTKPINNYN